VNEERCRLVSADVDEPMAGTAPYARAWIALEQNGPWGARAFTASHLDPEAGAKLERLAAAHDVRPALIRRPGRHADRHADGAPSARRSVLIAHTHPDNTWLLVGCIDEAAELLDLDWPALSVGDLDSVVASLPGFAPSTESHLLVCTNGTRDLCCAVEGRPVATATCERFPGRVWETTHTSGHRFAATAVVLPFGTLHGRLDVDQAAGLLGRADGGETVLASSRGRSCWSPPGQVAEFALRELLDETRINAIRVRHVAPTNDVTSLVDVIDGDGRAWAITVRIEPSDVSRPESCGKPVVHMSQITVEIASS
jgi:hypothetical protein